VRHRQLLEHQVALEVEADTPPLALLELLVKAMLAALVVAGLLLVEAEVAVLVQ
jgi:hypothetical protein